MIDFFTSEENSESLKDFVLENEVHISNWISEVITGEGYEEGEVTYVFCDDAYLHNLNVQFLSHDTLTDIISFDYSLGKQVHGEIYISVERVIENAKEYKVVFTEELHRVMIHGILHYCGYKDKSESEAKEMRRKEDRALELRKFI